MKKKNWATRMISGLLSAMMVLTTVVTPMTVMASEIIPEDELREYVSSLPELKDVKDQLDPDEIVNAKMDRNEQKYPVEKARGSAVKYDRL